MDETLLDAHVALRLAALARHAAFVPSTAASDAVRGKLRAIHEEGTARGLERGGTIHAVLAWSHDPEAWYGVPVSRVALACALRPSADGGLEPTVGEPELARWLDAVLDAELPRMEADLELMLDAHDRSALSIALAHGLSVDSLQLLGDPARALARLAPKDGARPTLPAGLRLARIDEAHVDAVVALHRETFSREPRFCWFGANPKLLESLRETLEESVDRGLESDRVLLHAGRVVGHASGTLRADPLFGHTAGIGIVLSPELRGRGLLRPIYRALLDHAASQRARTFKGGTSQPPVLHLARVMERPLHAVSLRRARLSEPRVFSPYLPELGANARPRRSAK